MFNRLSAWLLLRKARRQKFSNDAVIAAQAFQIERLQSELLLKDRELKLAILGLRKAQTRLEAEVALYVRYEAEARSGQRVLPPPAMPKQ